MRLENGQNFQTATGSNSIAHTLWTGDLALDEDRVSEVTKLRHVGLKALGKGSTATTIGMTHYVDCATGGTAVGTGLTASRSGKRLIDDVRSLNNDVDGVFHGIKLEMTTNNETVGFEPLYLTLFYDGVRQKTRG